MPPRVCPRGSMNQASVFYTPEWSEEVDELFILGLCEQTSLGNWLPMGGMPNCKIIGYARDRVNGHNHTRFSYATCLDRFRRLYQRYITFRYIIDRPGVEHDERTHFVTAPEGIWNRIYREHTLAYAYMRMGEVRFDSLEFIFTTSSRIPEPRNEVIEISSDHDTMSIEIANGGVFDSELAWYNSNASDDTDVQSTNLRDTGTSGVHIAGGSIDRSGRRSSILSSRASCSPFKPL